MKRIILAAFVLGIFLVSGCLQTTEQSGAEKQGTTFLGIFGKKAEAPRSFVGGVVGLEASFISGRPPSKIFPNVPFEIAVQLNNKGESDLKIGDVKIVLNNAGALGITDPRKPNLNLLSGSKIISNSVIPGDFEVVEYAGAKFTGEVLTEEQELPISVTLCYPYTTKAKIDKTCISLDEKICKPDEFKAVEVSGAPISVESFEQFVLPSKDGLELGFTIIVRNVGKEDVYSSTANCEDLQQDKKDVIELKSIKLGNAEKISESKCTSLALKDNEGKITCRVPIKGSADFEDVLSLELGYKYKQRVSKSIPIIPIPA